MSRSAWYANGSKHLLRLNMQTQCTVPSGNAKDQPSSSTFRGRLRTWSFYIVVLQRTAKKCTKSYDACAQLLFCSLNLLFNDVLVAVVVVVCLSSLIMQQELYCQEKLTFGIQHSLIRKTISTFSTFMILGHRS